MSGNKKSLDEPIKNFYCVSCDYSTSQKTDYNKHMLTRKHLRRAVEIGGNKVEKNGNEKSSCDHKSRYHCSKCNYSTNLSSDFNKHESSAKHIIATATNKLECSICKAIFKSASGIWKHKQKCKTVIIEHMFKKKYSLLKYLGKSKRRKTLRKRHKICRSNNHCKRHNKSKRHMRGG